MSQEHDLDLTMIEEFFEERARWASLNVTIQEIINSNEELVRDISEYDFNSSVALLASLLTLPEYQSNCLRIEVLIAIAMVCCKGNKAAQVSDIARWFSTVGETSCTLGEDPAEDVFVSLVHDKDGDYRLLEGIWEASGFYTQRFLDVIESMPDEGLFVHIKNSVKALLIVSDIVCEKSDLNRYQLGSDSIEDKIDLSNFQNENTLTSRVMITTDELTVRGVAIDFLAPFFFVQRFISELDHQEVGNSHVDNHPLIKTSDGDFIVALPTALSIAVRNYLIMFVYEEELISAFDLELSNAYSRLFHDTPILGDRMKMSVGWKKEKYFRHTYFAYKFDVGSIISFHVILPSIAFHFDKNFKSIISRQEDMEKTIQSTIDLVIDKFSGEDDFKTGQIVLVGCGWGKGLRLDSLEVKHEGWHFHCFSCPDLIRASFFEGMSPSYLWSIEDAARTISKNGVHITNINGILNLVGWIHKNEGHLIPHSEFVEGRISIEAPLMLAPPSNSLRTIRNLSDKSYDRHRIVDHLGYYHLVQRTIPNSMFGDKSVKQIYISIDNLENGVLSSVYEGKNALWLSLSTPNNKNRNLVYRLFEMANEWLHRIGRVIDRLREVKVSRKSVKVYITFLDEAIPRGITGDISSKRLLSFCNILDYEEKNSVQCIFDKGFIEGFGLYENVAEEVFAKVISSAYLNLFDLNLDEFDKNSFIEQVVTNDTARSFHLLQAQSYLDYVRHLLPCRLIKVDPINDATIKLGLGWKALSDQEGNNIEGKESCCKSLKKIVDCLLSEIREELRDFHLHSTLKRLILNIEKSHAEKDHWKKTSSAILGLHGGNERTINRYVKEMSELSGAGVTSRLLVEIALCECSTSTANIISDIELSKLIARMALVFRVGGLSDAIYYNALSPRITISALGDILFQDDFGDMVVQPMLIRHIGEQFVENADYQKKHYTEPEVSPSVQHQINSEFWEIWIEEFGFSIDEAREIIGSLEDEGIRREEVVLTLSRKDIIDLISSEIISQETADSFLKQFSLCARSSWEEVPKGYSNKDIFPWRFGRRLSYTSKPILQIDSKDNPTFIFSPSSLRESFAYVFDGAFNGRLDQEYFKSKRMKKTWIGKAGEGHSFTIKSANYLKKIGWRVRDNIGLPEILQKKLDRDFGDVDILAWSIDSSEVLVIECKNLSFARTYSEVAAQLSNFQGVIKSNGKGDKLRVHMDRFSHIQDNIDSLCRFTGISSPKLRSCLACNGVVPMQYSKLAVFENMYVGSIEDILNQLSS